MFDYIDNFCDKEDVLTDLHPYLQLLQSPEDIADLRGRLQGRIEQIELAEDDLSDEDEDFSVADED